MHFIKVEAIIFLTFVVIGIFGFKFLMSYLNDFEKIEKPIILTLAEKTLKNKFKLKFIQSKIKKFPSGSVLVIPLIPIPIGKKQEFVTYYFEVENDGGSSLWRGGEVRRYSEGVSIYDLEIAQGIEYISKVSPRVSSSLMLSLAGGPLNDEDETSSFIRDNQILFEKAFGGPIELVIKYLHQASSSFKDDTGLKAYMPWPGYLEFKELPTELKTKDKSHLSLKVKLNKDGLLDLKNDPEIFGQLNEKQRSFLLSKFSMLDTFKDEQGKSLKSYIADANKAYQGSFK